MTREKHTASNLSLFMTLLIICESEIREIYTFLAIQCMQAYSRGCFNSSGITALLSCLVSVSGTEQGSNISNTSDSVSSGYPNTEKKVENTTRSGLFLTKFEVFG